MEVEVTDSEFARSGLLPWSHPETLNKIRIRNTPVLRTDPQGVYPLADLEEDVKFFVLMLEQLGAKTHFSCGGHPRGFYIVFKATYALAKKIAACGFFSVEIAGESTWRLSLNSRQEKRFTEARKQEILSLAAENWERVLGPLFIDGVACPISSEGKRGTSLPPCTKQRKKMGRKSGRLSKNT